MEIIFNRQYYLTAYQIKLLDILRDTSNDNGLSRKAICVLLYNNTKKRSTVFDNLYKLKKKKLVDRYVSEPDGRKARPIVKWYKKLENKNEKNK